MLTYPGNDVLILGDSSKLNFLNTCASGNRSYNLKQLKT